MNRVEEEGRNVKEDKGKTRARGFYVTIKFNYINLTTRPETKPKNKQGSTC